MWLWREAKISSSSNDKSSSEGSRFCSTSSSSESASDGGGQGDRDLVGESDGGAGERLTRLIRRAEAADALSELALERGAVSVERNMSNACRDPDANRPESAADCLEGEKDSEVRPRDSKSRGKGGNASE